jgi:Dolichyl-phosphate-mannose-protein mannosyltransferase
MNLVPWSGTRFRLLSVALAFVLFALWYGFGIEQRALTQDFVDPVSRIPAQDEAVYGHEAIHMHLTGHWLTPVYLGRYALNKPPLLQWLAAGSVRVFGISAWALRLPSLLAAVGATTLVFWIIWRIHSLLSATFAALLLASSHLFYVFSRLAMTDMLLAFFIVLAMAILLCDPQLERGSSLTLFAAAAGGAILTKAAAGAIPVIALAVLRPRLSRALAAIALAAAIALPWHLYQLVVHPRWFFSEYVLTQHFAVGLAAPPQYSNENHFVFYARRLFLMDPVLTVAVALSLPLIARIRNKRPAVLIFPAVLVLALFAFRYRSAYYVLPLLPALAILAAEGFAVMPARLRAILLATVLACAIVKTAYPAATWGIPAALERPPAIATSLEAYCGQHRAVDLILIASDDQFFASDLPLHHVRYCLLQRPSPATARPPLDFAALGITVTVPEFNRTGELLPVWRERLARFGLPSTEPVATVITASSTAKIQDLIAAHPEADFWIPGSILRRLNLLLAHRVQPAAEGVFLLAPHAAYFTPGRPCHL